MAIRIRRGNKIDFDPNKMVAGELGLALDSGELYFCYSPGNVKRLQTAEDLQNLLNASPEAYTALQQLADDLTANPNELANILSNISNLNTNKLDKTGNSKDNIVTFVEAGSDTDIVSGETHATIFGKILKTIKVLRENITKKIDRTSIVNNDTSGGTDKVASAEVVKVHGQEIDDLASEVTAINNNFAEGTFSPKINNTGVVHSVQDGYYIKTGKLITIFAKIETTSKSTEPSSNVITIGGFPFPPSAKSVGRTLFNIKVANATTALGATVGHFASPSIFTISTLGNNSTNLYNAIKVSDTTDTTHIWISGQYFVD